MMRPVTVHVARALPAKPVLTLAAGADLTWTDGTPVDYSNAASWANPGTAEVGYRVERATVSSGRAGAYTIIANAPANTVAYTDGTAVQTLTYDYRVTAWNAAGNSSSNVIRIAPSTTVVTSNRNPSVFGQAITFTAQVTPAAATGTVQFSIDGTKVGSPVALAKGRATFIANAPPVANALAVGSHAVSAVFSGSVNYRTSTSADLTQTVNKAASGTVLTSSGTPSAPGLTVVFTATVTAKAPGVGTPTATVQFRVDGLDVGGPVPLDASGQATYSISTLTLGKHVLLAFYTGDAGFKASTSKSFTQTIR